MGVKLTIHLQLVSRSRKCGSIHPLHHTPSWQGQLYLFNLNHAIGQALSHWHPIVVRSRGISGGQSSIGAGFFFQGTSVSPFSSYFTKSSMLIIRG
jgi:hypothetical protein